MKRPMGNVYLIKLIIGFIEKIGEKIGHLSTISGLFELKLKQPAPA